MSAPMLTPDDEQVVRAAEYLTQREAEAEAWNQYVAEALRYGRALPPDPDASWLSPNQARIVALVYAVNRLEPRRAS